MIKMMVRRLWQLMFSGGTTNQVMTYGANGPAWATPSAGAGDTFTKAVLAADLSKTNNTFSDLSGFAFSIAANETWEVRLNLIVTGTSTEGYRFQATGPASPTRVQSGTTFGSGASGFSAPVDASQDFATLVGKLIVLTYIITNGSNAGTVQFQFAQVNTSGTPCVVSAQSQMIAHKVS